MVVAVQVVGRDVEQHGDVGFKIEHIVELEAAQLDNVYVVMLRSHLICEASADIACQSDVDTGIFQDVVGEHRCCGFAVTTGDAHHLGVGIASGEFNLRDYGDALCARFDDERGVFGNARALDYFVGIEDALLGVTAFFPCNVVLLKTLFVAVGNCAHVRQPYVEAFNLCKYGSTYAAFSAS